MTYTRGEEGEGEGEVVSYDKRLVSFMTYTRGEEGEGEEEVVSYEQRLVSFITYTRGEEGEGGGGERLVSFMNLIVDKSTFLFSR